MTLNISAPTTPAELKPRIIVFGVGGAGCNAVNNMLRSSIEGVECVVANTDSQALQLSLCERRIQLGMNITQGLGAGSRPEIGRAAAEEGIEDITAQLQGAHMVFITAGMGGGTGTGSAPVLARTAREHGLLTVGVVTKPFHFEGAHRMRVAEAGIEELQDVVDTLIVIPNQNLFRVANEKTTFADAFSMADEVLHSGVRGITDLMVMPGLINLDFADIRTVMTEMGKAMMGAGEADGENRAIEAAEAAISNPLLDEVSMAGARGLLINITGGSDLTLYEVDEAANRIRDEVDPGANIIFGSTFDEGLNGRMRVSVFATGIEQPVGAIRPRDVEVPMIAPRVPAPKAAIHDDVDVGSVQPADDIPSSVDDDSEDDPRMNRYVEEPVAEIPEPAAHFEPEMPAMAARETILPEAEAVGAPMASTASALRMAEPEMDIP
ncbi:MAG: cell division protein FtsZ, partial [Pseudomonadota bacterium]